MAVVTAETGYGKSRLVQELYLRLSSDAQWDPAESNYWPDAFRGAGEQLRTNPDMSGIEPKGPPRFMWLGVRWQPPDVRNADLRPVLPDLKSELSIHLRIVERHREGWERVLEARRKALGVKGLKQGALEAFGAGAEKVAENIGIPFAGLALKLLGGAKDAVQEQLSGPRTHDAIREEATKDLVDDLLECLDALMHGPYGRPTVLWLDDAQWADPQAMAFLERAWAQAQRRRWPLLVVATHWEREWRELLRREPAARAGTLAAFDGRAGVEVKTLGKAADADLRALLLARLPGLRGPQVQMLLEKAAGNFLSMVENIGDLSREAQHFEGDDVRGALSEEGEAFVQTWESDRARRVSVAHRRGRPDGTRRTDGTRRNLGGHRPVDVE